MAKEVGPSNIKVNAIAPGIIDTDMNKHLSREDLIELENEIPLSRIGKVEDIANTVKSLIDSTYITGQVITVDGGWTI